MTSLDPTHIPLHPFRGKASEGQALHRPAGAEPSKSSSSFPDELPRDSDNESSDEEMSVDGDARAAQRRARREGRKRVQNAMLPIPDQRLEQSYLLSIRPFLKPRPSRQVVQEKGPVQESTDEKAAGSDGPSKSLVTSAEEDEVFHWGREIDVDWRMVGWVTVRDHLLSPLFQGALWGFGSIFLAGTAAAFRSAMYPASHIPKGRITGGPGGKVEQAGGGDAIAPVGWWRNFVKSWAGAFETAAVA